MARLSQDQIQADTSIILENFFGIISKEGKEIVPGLKDNLEAHVSDALGHANNCDIVPSLHSASEAIIYSSKFSSPEATSKLTEQLIFSVSFLTDRGCGCHRHY